MATILRSAQGRYKARDKARQFAAFNRKAVYAAYNDRFTEAVNIADSKASLYDFINGRPEDSRTTMYVVYLVQGSLPRRIVAIGERQGQHEMEITSINAKGRPTDFVTTSAVVINDGNVKTLTGHSPKSVYIRTLKFAKIQA